MVCRAGALSPRHEQPVLEHVCSLGAALGGACGRGGVVRGVLGNGQQAAAPRRFSGLATSRFCGRRVPIATTRLARLLGLARLDRAAAGPGLLIPRCRCVHTFGMRFPLRLVFLDEAARPLSVRKRVPPRRIASERRAHSVLELPAEEVS